MPGILLDNKIVWGISLVKLISKQVWPNLIIYSRAQISVKNDS